MQAGASCSHGYWFCTNNQDFNEARADCMSVGADLLSINSEGEQVFVRSYATGGNQWIMGLNKKAASGQNPNGVWEFADGSLAMDGYENFGNGEPDNSDCGAMDSGYWIDWSCTNDENFMCEVE